ncbi:Dienelactone hydrolase family protein [Enterococcus malodoratus]|uniref:dienelactone hydrolase family protein n=1 Tax=Enterococcus malodoratus TaxID=71451 RepID=UPI0008CBDB64|nr:dienelactone hydrolase family protein [Enterococcus malodoratus]SET52294.1 Dienelactone hydrolase family protein [Enterococcus malodoratus]
MNDKNLIKGSENAVIILHEIYGLNQFILDVCNQYSEKGYDVFCPDLLGNNCKGPR